MLEIVIKLLINKLLEARPGSRTYIRLAYHRTFALLRSKFKLLTETLDLLFQDITLLPSVLQQSLSTV